MSSAVCTSIFRARRALLALAAAPLIFLAAPQQPVIAQATAPQDRVFGALAPAFVANNGKTNAAAQFVAVGGGRPIFLTPRDVRLVDLRHHTSLWLTFVGAEPATLTGETQASGTVTYLQRSAAAISQTAYRDVAYHGLWRGIDARVAGVEGGIEYSFEVAPGADPRAVHLRYDGADRMRLNAAGEIVLDTGSGEVVDRAPTAYQRVNGDVVPVDVRFVLRGSEVTFAVGRYDRSRALTIDPTLVYSTYLGGSGYDAGNAIAVDAAGAAYVAGTTRYSDFPSTPGAYQTTFGGGTTNMPTDAFVAKINPDGTHFDYVTYLGGSRNDEAFGIAVDAGGNAYIAGYTESSDFPSTSGAYRAAMGISGHDGFLTKLNATGSALVYSTFFGTNGSTDPKSVAVDSSGNAYVTGLTLSGNLPVTVGGNAPNNNSASDAFLLKFNSAGSQVTFGTYIGGQRADAGTSVAIDGSGHAFVTGWTRSIDRIAGSTTPGTNGVIVEPNPNGASFKSADGAQTFSNVNSYVHTSSVLSIAIDPLQPSTVYEGTRDMGLLKTTDGGAHWTQPSAQFRDLAEVDEVVVNPAAPSTLLAVAGFLYRSSDAGANWTRVIAESVGHVAFAPSDPSIAYAVGAAAGVLKSTDSGATWRPVLAVSARSLAIDPANPAVVYAGTGSADVMKTTDGGATWSRRPITGAPATLPAVISMAVDPTLTSDVWAGTDTGGVYKSADGGTSWTRKSENPGVLCGCNTTISVYYPGRMVFDGGTLYIADGGTFSANVIFSLWKTSDHGATFSPLNVRGNSLALNTVAASQGLVYVGLDAHVDAFLVKYDTNATFSAFMYGTYLGGSYDDYGVGVAVDPSGRAVVALQTSSADVPTTSSVAWRPAALQRLSANGDTYMASTFVGPDTHYSVPKALAVDANYNAYVTGFGREFIAVWIDRIDLSGAVTGEFWIDGQQSNVGSPVEMPAGIAVHGPSDVFVTGSTTSVDFPTTPNAPQRFYGSGESDAFISKVSFADASPPPPPPPANNIALNKPVAVSSVEASQHAGANAVDGSTSTRWSSQFSDPQWISIDLGRPYSISEVVLRWEAAYGADYQIQMSNDGATWTTIRSVTNGAGGVNDLTGLSGTGRYVRVYGTRRGTQWGYSLWEVEVYGTVVPPPPPPPPSSTNIALNKTVAASSTESAQYAAANAVDGSTSTRWSSQFSDPQWIYVDLTQTYSISEIVLRWETAYGADYQVQVSNDASTWTTIRTVTNGDGGVDDATGLSGTGRYVRVFATRRGTQWGYSLWELEVYGTLVSPPPPPPPSNGNVVVYASDIPAASRHGSWTTASDTTSPNGIKLVTPDGGFASNAAPLAAPTHYVDVTVTAAANTPYTIWLRLQATANSKFNDALWVQFSDATINGSAVYPIGSTSGLLVNLATDGTGGSLNGWGWQNTAYWLAQPTRVSFPTSGTHTLRLQVREDGVQFDQIVLSPSQYLSAAPGPTTSDATIVPRP